MIKAIQKLFRKSRNKSQKQKPTEIAVPVYLPSANPELKWADEHSVALSDFLQSETGKLLIELYRVEQVKKMMRATSDGNVFACGVSNGFGEAIDLLEGMKARRTASEPVQEFRTRDSWVPSSGVVINKKPIINNV